MGCIMVSWAFEWEEYLTMVCSDVPSDTEALNHASNMTGYLCEEKNMWHLLSVLPVQPPSTITYTRQRGKETTQQTDFSFSSVIFSIQQNSKCKRKVCEHHNCTTTTVTADAQWMKIRVINQFSTQWSKMVQSFIKPHSAITNGQRSGDVTVKPESARLLETNQKLSLERWVRPEELPHVNWIYEDWAKSHTKELMRI